MTALAAPPTEPPAAGAPPDAAPAPQEKPGRAHDAGRQARVRAS